MPDSGAEALVLFDQAESVADSAAVRTTVGVAGLTGTRVAQTAVVRRLRVGPTLLSDVPAVIVRRQGGSPSVDGLLPLHLFAGVTFNGPERQLFIQQR